MLIALNIDRDSKIDPDFSHGLTQIGERTFRILARVTHHNVVTSTEHHLVKAEIFEIANAAVAIKTQRPLKT